MRREEVIRKIRENLSELDQFDVRSLALFGSVARDEATADSDVDVLVEFGRATFDGYMGLKFFLEDLLGTAVDVATIDSLRPWLRERVLQEAVDVAA
jgi:predicted nucleotidyltransferase